jgi:hypothetical protein
MQRILMVALFGLVGTAILVVTIASLPPQVTSAQTVQGTETEDPADFSDLERYEIKKGLAIAPVPLDLAGKNSNLVGLGSYIVNTQAGCSDCHTNPPYVPGNDPFLGQPTRINKQHYLAGGTEFGPFVSRNITPDAHGLPAGLTLHDFVQVMRRGTDFDKIPPNVPSADNDLLQVMPWPVYRHMHDRDLRALYEYLRAIPHAEPAPASAGANQSANENSRASGWRGVTKP